MKKGSRNKRRDMEAPAVKGSTPRAYQTHPGLSGGDAASLRGTPFKKMGIGTTPPKANKVKVSAQL